MKAVFVHHDTLLRDSHVALEAHAAPPTLVPATLEAMRSLAAEDRLVVLFGDGEGPDHQSVGGEHGHAYSGLVAQIHAAGGRVDTVVTCGHSSNDPCRCWGAFPGALWLPAVHFGLALNECYVLGDSVRDAETAVAAGARPLLVLCGRSIGGVLGNRPSHKDYPVAENLTTAVNYIGVEDEISRQLGHPRGAPCALPAADVLFAEPDQLPSMTAISPLAHELRAKLARSRAQLRDVARWLMAFVLGALGLSLGVAYMLTHLYRVQPFPQFVYYVTLQFISRPLRGALFMLCGLGIIAIAMRRLYRATMFDFLRRRRR